MVPRGGSDDRSSKNTQERFPLFGCWYTYLMKYRLDSLFRLVHEEKNAQHYFAARQKNKQEVYFFSSIRISDEGESSFSAVFCSSFYQPTTSLPSSCASFLIAFSTFLDISGLLSRNNFAVSRPCPILTPS